MPDRMKINDQVTVGPQPGKDEIAPLKEQGFRSVVNFRTDGEEGQPLSPDAEKDVVESAGLTYLHIPVSMKSMSAELVDRFPDQYQDLPKPIFAHCKSGKRAGAMVMMNMAVENDMTGEAALQTAKDMGFECDQPELESFVRDYVNNHTK